jgi:hypothetical protein
VLLLLPEGAFPIEKWSAALTYLYGAPLEFDSVSNAKAYCREHPLSETQFID